MQVLTLCGTRDSLWEPSSPRFQGERKACVWRSAWQLCEGSVQVAELREGVSGRGIGLGGTLHTLALYLLPNLAKGRSQPPPSGAARVSCLRKQDPAARGLHSGSSGRRPSPTPRGGLGRERGRRSECASVSVCACAHACAVSDRGGEQADLRGAAWGSPAHFAPWSPRAAPCHQARSLRSHLLCSPGMPALAFGSQKDKIQHAVWRSHSENYSNNGRGATWRCPVCCRCRPCARAPAPSGRGARLPPVAILQSPPPRPHCAQTGRLAPGFAVCGSEPLAGSLSLLSLSLR